MAALKIHSGLFRHKFKLENPVKEQDIAGGHSEDFEQGFDVVTRGYFREKKGSRELNEGTDLLIWEYEAYTWWRSVFESNITKDTRLIHDDGRIFQIVSFKRMEEDRQFYQFLLITAQ